MVIGSAVGTAIWIGLGVVVMVVVWRVGMAMLTALSAPPLPPPEPGELRKVNVRYRCDVCGVELKLTMAPDDDPPPPRHCLEDMVVVAPLYE
jgi:hypothetical protein